MGQVGAKMRNTTHGFAWWCPGCNEAHPLPFKKGWTFDGNVEAPTFSPSFKHTSTKFPAYDERGLGLGKPITWCCHYIITSGRVQFCGDSMHALAGQTIDMPDLPPDLTDWGRPAPS